MVSLYGPGTFYGGPELKSESVVVVSEIHPFLSLTPGAAGARDGSASKKNEHLQQCVYFPLNLNI